MKKHEPMQVGAIIEQAIAAAGATDNFRRHHASYLWPEVVGPTINRMTTRRWVDGDTLHVCIASGPLRNDLSFMTETITRRINNAAGETLIRRIIIH